MHQVRVGKHRSDARPLPFNTPTVAPTATAIRYSAAAIRPPLMPSTFTLSGLTPDTSRSNQDRRALLEEELVSGRSVIVT